MLHTEAVENKKYLYFQSVRMESPESHPLRHKVHSKTSQNVLFAP